MQGLDEMLKSLIQEQEYWFIDDDKLYLRHENDLQWEKNKMNQACL